MASAEIILTVLDLPEILEEALDAVPGWERAALHERLDEVIVRARREKAR